MKGHIARDLLVVTLATAGANLLLTPGNPGWEGIQPHPFLLPVVLVASRYGSPTAALLCALLLLGYEAVQGWPNPLTSPHAGLWASCVAAAALVGSLFDQYRHRHHEMQKDLAECRSELQSSQQQREVLEQAVRELRSRILGAEDTFVSLCQLARRLTTLSPEQLYRSCLELACRQTEASGGHFFILKQGAWSAVAHHPGGSRPKCGPEDSQLVAQALAQGQLCAAASAQSLQLGPNEPLIAVPLQVDKEILGVLTFDELPFQRFHPATFSELESIADWAARAMIQVTRYCDKESRLEEGQSAFRHLLAKLRDIPLQKADLPLMQALAEPMLEMLLQGLLSAHHQPTLRSNLLMILESVALTSGQLDQIEEFVRSEQAWIGQICRDYGALQHQPQAPEFTLLLSYLRHNLRERRGHWLRAWALIRPQARKALQDLIHFPVLSSQPASLPTGLEALLGQAFGETMNLTLEVQNLGLHLEELLLDFLGRPDPHLLCATLHGLTRLGSEKLPPGWRTLQPGSLASQALELCDHADPRVRESAWWCIHRLALPADRLEAARKQSESDPDPRVRRAALGAAV